MTNLKNLLLNKQKKISFSEGMPGINFGKDGDMTVRYIKGQGLFLFIKMKSKWYASRFTIYSPKNQERKESIYLPINKLPKASGELTIKGSKAYVGTGGSSRKQIISANASKKLDISEISTERTTSGDGSDTSHSTSDFKIINTAGHANLRLETRGSTYDAYILFCYFTGEVLKQWTFGIDNNDVDKMKWDYNSHITPIIPGSNTKLVLDTSGNLEITGTLDIGSLAGDNTLTSLLVQTGGLVKTRTVSSLGILAFDGSTANGVLTYKDADEATVESSLTYTANNLLVGGADSRIGADISSNAAGYDLDVHAGNANGTNNAGGDLYLNAGRSTGNVHGGNIYITSSIKNAGAGVTLRGEVTLASLTASSGRLRLNQEDGTPGEFITYNRNDDEAYATLDSGGLSSAKALSIDAGIGTLTIQDDGTTYAQFETSGSVFKLFENGGASTADYFKIACATAGATTISTVDAFGVSANLIIDPDGYLELNSGGLAPSIRCEDPLKIKESADAVGVTAGYGQLWVHDDAPNNLMFTDDGGQDIHLTKNTAVWGGGFPRTTGHNGKWLGIPTGHQGGVLSFGTTISAPDVAYNPVSTADDLGAVIWQSIHSIRVTNCRIWYGQGGATNTRHSVCLMRYAIDTNGTLSSGVEVAGVDDDGGSDDYTTLAFTDLTMTSDVTVTNAQVLIAMVYLKDAANAAATAKCILEYQDLP